MAFIDVFTVETEHRSIYGVPSNDEKSFKIFILEYLLVKVPEDTLEKSRLIYYYEKYNIGDSVTEQAISGGIGQPVPNPTPFLYLKRDGSNTMEEGYTPTNPLSVVTLEYFNSNGTGLLLGTTSTTAYRGDYGNIAYNHSQLTHAPSDAEKNRAITDSLTTVSSIISASASAVKLLNDNKAAANHNHDTQYEPINPNIQAHISNTGIHITTAEGLVDVPPYSGNQGKILKVNATEDGTIWGDPSGVSVSWGDISGTIGLQTDLLALLDDKVDDFQVLTNVPAGAVFTDTVYNDAALQAHIVSIGDNPHSVSATNIGLSEVDNTSDLNKPLSTATIQALSEKQDSFGVFTEDYMFLRGMEDGSTSWDDPLKLQTVPVNIKSGINIQTIAAEDLVIGDMVYFLFTGKVSKANASSAATSPAIGVVTTPAVADSSVTILLFGILINGLWSLTVGKSIYLDTENGEITQIKPSALGDIIQVVGVAIGEDRMLFNPSMSDTITEVVDITGPDQVTIIEITQIGG